MTLAWLIVLLCLACSRPSDLSGRYEATYSGLSGPVQVVMILAADGSGKWEIEGEELPFSWFDQSGGVRVHTRDGAVVEGVQEGRDVRLDVPGVGKLFFVRR
jgi:hypothetical protein